MPKIVFKQRHRDPETKKKYTPARNAGKLEYIGDKPEALKNEISGNGLFGYVRGGYATSMDMKQEQSYLRKMTTPHRDIFHAVYSFASSDADAAGLHTAKDWQDWTRYRISEIARHMNKKIENIEWYASVHLKEGQPHVHLMWWDIAQKIAINVVEPKICDDIRITATTNTYRGFYTELHNQEDNLLKEMRGIISDQTDNILSAAKLGSKRNLQVAAMLNRIYNSLPPKGQLKYAYVPGTIKNNLDKLTAYLIKSDPELKSLYDDILDARRLYNEALHSSDANWGRYQLAKYEGQLNDDIKTGVGNTILKLLSREKRAHHERLFDAMNIPEPDMKVFEEELLSARQVGKHIYWSKDFKAARTAERQDDNIEKALELYQKEAVKGNVLAVYEIADLYRRGLIHGEDKSESFFAGALAGFKEVEEKNEKMRPYLQYRIGRMYYDGYGTEQDFAEALNWLEKSAQGGNHLSQYTVGKMYHKGTGTEMNAQKAEQYYKQAAESGNIYAGGALAKLYLGGRIPNSAKEGEQILLELSNKAKDDYKVYIQYILGMAYHTNEEIHDDSKAFKMLLLSADGGNIQACYAVGKMYHKGEGTEVSVQKAEQYYKRATEGGNIYAGCALAKLYFDGIIPNSAKKGERLMLKILGDAKDDDKTYIQYVLGMAYHTNEEIHDDNKAFNTLLLSADGGNIQACYAVGKMYHKGEGTEVNTQKAEQYYQKAVNGGFLYANGALAKLYLDGSIPNSAKKGEKLLLNILNNANGEYRAYIQYILGAAYHYNDDIRDDSKARELLTQSANSGNEYAAALIARMDNADEANIANLLRSTLMLLRNASSSTNRSLHDMSAKMFGRGDLSKEAIAELIYKLQDKQNTAEM